MLIFYAWKKHALASFYPNLNMHVEVVVNNKQEKVSKSCSVMAKGLRSAQQVSSSSQGVHLL